MSGGNAAAGAIASASAESNAGGRTVAIRDQQPELREERSDVALGEPSLERRAPCASSDASASSVPAGSVIACCTPDKKFDDELAVVTGGVAEQREQRGLHRSSGCSVTKSSKNPVPPPA